MAKPIRATPTLTSKESNKFLEKMLAVEKRKPTKVEKAIFQAISNF